MPGGAAGAESLAELLARVRACRRCEEFLPLGPRPVLRAASTSRLLIVGQAPGTAVHESGTPWDDPSGERLRDWLQLDHAAFYDERRVAILPMGFCYPGRGKSGDLPPRPECAPLWMEALLHKLPRICLTLAIGQYAQAWFLGSRRSRTLTETVRRWRDFAPEVIPLPHPSPRNNIWLKKNPWFEQEVVPELRAQVSDLFCDD